MTVIGGDRVAKKLKDLPDRVKKYVDQANKKSGDELISIAKVLIPNKSGENRAQIKGTALESGAYLADFGPKSKVIEGKNGPRPFVNPALKVSRKRHRGRAKRAASKAVKELFNG
ncbi:hypothetical protein AQS8620_01302 [Aquimixticola soesokkakensis]|uniref:Phage protein, HK97 gp10 family n=1 Tax=Aquimixticola soesokkakensis TaxID=1519096 RepID=A0A1Y5SCN3_9RHOB|nr:hypothetical protein [Aquimixticola soesokkakensis]SLN36584.1 hypothetical protein AQS8620_01302 [Aquimixticola soesokkakensis]